MTGAGHADPAAEHRDRLPTRQPGAVETAAQVRAAGDRAEVTRLDTTALDRCGDVVNELADRLGGVDVFVNNAGTGTSGLALELTAQQWRQVVTADLDGAFLCLQRTARRMAAAGA